MPPDAPVSVIHRGRLIQLNLESVTLPDGRRIELEIVRHPGGAVIAAVNGQNEVCVLRQYRHATREGFIWELPAGCTDPGDPTPLTTAQRELREEAGVRAGQWRELGPIYPTPGFCDEVLHLFLARDLDHTARDPQQDEVIEVHWLPLEDAAAMALDGRIQDSKTIAGLLRARHRIQGATSP